MKKKKPQVQIRIYVYTYLRAHTLITGVGEPLSWLWEMPWLHIYTLVNPACEMDINYH